jgi:hypothetical protein
MPTQCNNVPYQPRSTQIVLISPSFLATVSRSLLSWFAGSIELNPFPDFPLGKVKLVQRSYQQAQSLYPGRKR